MRRAFIGFSFIVFLVYAWASVAYQNAVPVPPADPEAQDAFLEQKYLLRDTVYNPSNPQGEPLLFGGSPVDESVLDTLRQRGITSITVTGIAPAVNFLPGTAIMVALIFLTFVAALKPVVWDPFVVMLEKRTKLLERGTEAQRKNQLEADRFAAERDRRNAEVTRDNQALRLAGQRETAKDAGAIVKAAREKEKEVKLAGLRDIAASAAETRAAVEADIPALAEAVADAIMPKGAAKAAKG